MTAEPLHERHLASHIFNLAMMVFGAGALAWMMRDLGWTRFRDAVAGVGRMFGVILGLDLAAILLDARALHTFMRPEARMVSYWRVVAAQISGRAVNVVTPLGALGEATKLTMLVGHAPRVRVLSAIVLFNLASLYISVTVMLIGTPITLLLVDLPRSLKLTAGFGLGAVVAVMAMVGVLVHRGAASTLTGLLHRIRIVSAARLARWRARLDEVDSHLRELHDSRSTGTWKGVLWLAASKLVTWTATMTLIGSVGAAITWIASVVPLGLGLADGGNYALFGLLGASGIHGTFVTMLNRGRSALVALVGFVVMAIVHTGNRIALARVHRKLRELKDRARQ
jgi:hypothetical protein